MDTPVIKRVARAICKAESEGMGQGQTCDCDGKTQTYHYIFGGVDEMRDRPCPYRNEARAAISAYEKALEAEGFVIVPIVPTPAMVQRRIDRYPGELKIRLSDLAVWYDMLAALEGKDG